MKQTSRMGESGVEDLGVIPPVASLSFPDHHNNVRLVAVDENSQPNYLVRAMELETLITSAVARLGIETVDMPALHGFCVQAARSAEVRGS